MANLSEKRLREYSTEAQRLVDQRSLDAAVAIGQHMLRHYPKYIDAYRVLAKATLEQGEVGYAADLFKRVLSADPEDLESRVGLGIIYTDEEALEEALWQWERAFELAPGNPDIRTQLRQVRELLEGTELPRVELTRGALGRLYARGGLFQQAADEFQAVLRQDPDRVDVRLALAETLWRDAKLATAEAMCEQVLEALPNCLKANLILGYIWLHTGREEESHKSFRTAHALDPENQIATELLGKESPVTSEPVYIPRLDEALPEAPKPADLIAVEDEQLVSEPAVEGEEAELPDWLTQLRGVGIEEEVADGEAIPDWLTSPELAEAEEAAAQLTPGESLTAEPEQEPEIEEFEEGELPDWLAGLRAEEDEDLEEPVAVSPAETEEPLPEAEETADRDIPDWLHKVSAEVEEDLTDLGAVDLSQPEPAADGTVSRETPEWLQELQEEDIESPEMLSEDEILSSAAESGEATDWLTALEAEEAIEPGETEAPVEIEALPEEVEPDQEIPDWLTALDTEEAAEPEALEATPELKVTEVTELPEEIEPIEEAPDWLAALQTEESAEPEVTEGEPIEQVPEWLSALQTEEAAEPEAIEPIAEPEVAEIAELPEEAEPDEAEAPSESDVGETDMWREIMRQEGLADMIEAVPAETEALSEEIEADEEVPDWLAALQVEEAAEPEAIEPIVEPEVAESAELLEEVEVQPEEGAPEEGAPDDEVPDWLAALQAEEAVTLEAVEPVAEPEVAEVEDLPEEAEPDAEIPDWLAALKPEEAIELEAQAEAPPEPDAGETDMWREIMREEGLADMIEAVPAEAEALPEEIEADEEVPDWLAALQAEEAIEPAEAEAPPEPDAGETDMWREIMRQEGMADMIEAVPAEAEALPEEIEADEEAPDWLAALQAEEAIEPAEAEAPPEPDAGDTDMWREIMRQEGMADMIETAPTEPEEPPEEAEVQPEEVAPDEGAPDEVPDWLAALQAEEPLEPEAVDLAAEPAVAEIADLPEETEIPSEEVEPAEETPDWLAALQAEEAIEPAEAEAPPEPDAGETDMWREIMREEGLADMIEAAPTEPEELPEEAEVQPEEAAPKESVPDEVPDWLAALQAEEPTEVEIIELSPEPESVAAAQPPEAVEAGEEMPDWLAALQPEEPAAPEIIEAVEPAETPGEEEAITEPASEAQPPELEAVVESAEKITPASEEAVPDWLAGWQEESEAGAVEVKVAEEVLATEPIAPEPEIEEEMKEEDKTVSFLVSSYLARLKADPKDHEVRLALARAYRDERKLTSAFEQFESLVGSGHQVKELIPDLERLCASHADDVKWHQLLGDAYMRVNRLADALNAYREAQSALLH
jgi:cytochrome c-type biogenesis protein CcmH/NrfG